MPRFAILTHDHPTPHWDFLLETGASCLTWRLASEPGRGRVVPAEAIADHRPKYLSYEGPVGGGRGSVARWDAGSFEWLRDEAGQIEVRLAGDRIAGECELTQVDEASWHIRFGQA